jgi:methylase of polypeptide subunit release factors
MLSPLPDPSELTRQLSELGYTESGLRQLLGVKELSQLLPEDLPAYLERCRNSPLGALTRAFQLAQGGPADELQAAITRELGPVDLTPCQGLYVCTDQQLAARAIPDRVYQLGLDSLVLARVTPRKVGLRALDLCTGSGIHALLAARDHQSATGVDLNPRALRFAEHNAALNGLDNCNWLEGDLYAPVAGQRFDLITANPPFVPTPETDMELHRTGGESGEDIAQRLVAGLAEHLEAGGTFSMVLDYPIMQASTYLERLQRWLGEGCWGVAVLNFGNEGIEAYIRRHIDPLHTPDYARVYREYLASYARQGITAIGFANIFIRCLDRGGFAVERWMAIPSSPIPALVERWLQALTRFRDPDWEPEASWKPLVDTDHLGDIWLNHDRSRGILDMADASWSGPLSVDGRGARFAGRLAGRTSVEGLIAWWTRTFRVPAGVARVEVRTRLAWLGENLLLTER